MKNYNKLHKNINILVKLIQNNLSSDLLNNKWAKQVE